MLKQRVRDSMVHILYSRLCRKAEWDCVKSRGLGHLTQSSRLWVTGTVPNSATTGLGLNRTEKYYFLGCTVCTQQMERGSRVRSSFVYFADTKARFLV